MDPITAAIVGALALGIGSGVSKVSEKAILDAYEGLKNLLKDKFGEKSEVVSAVKSLESKPGSKGRRATLEEEIQGAKAEQDQQLLTSANKLLDLIKETPKGQAIVRQMVIGDKNVFSGTGDVTVTNQLK